jgi:hypothetical protein
MYAQEDLGPNGDNWYKALRKINALPESIPPLPSNVQEILASPCPIEGAPKRLTDTHSLWLIPGGKIKDIDALGNSCGERRSRLFLGPCHPGLPMDFLPNLRTPETIGLEEPKWVIVSDILPGSLRQTLHIQQKMIQELRNKSFINYEIPRFKYALAINLLKIQVDGVGPWARKLTRVQEEFVRQYPDQTWGGTLCSLTVGSVLEHGRTVTHTFRCCADQHDHSAILLWDSNVGMAAMWVGFSPKRAESSCVLS